MAEIVRPNPRWLRVNAVARRCGVTDRTVRYWAEAGILKACKRGPKLWAFLESDLERFLASGMDARVLSDRTNSIFFSAPSSLWGPKNKDVVLIAQIQDGGATFAITKGMQKGMVIASVPTGAVSDRIAFGACFFAIANCIFKNASQLQITDSLLNFSVSRDCPARATIQEGYNFIWRNLTPRSSVEIGDLYVHRTYPMSSTEANVTLEFRDWVDKVSQGPPREHCGIVSGLPVWGYRLLPNSSDRQLPLELPKKHVVD